MAGGVGTVSAGANVQGVAAAVSVQGGTGTAAGAGPALVQAATPTLNTQSITFGSNITPGNSVILAMSRNNGFTAPVTITGNGEVLTLAEVTANNFAAVYYYSGVGASPGATISAASGAAVLYAYEVPGAITLDQAVTSSTFGGSTGSTFTVSATTTSASEFWCGVVYAISGPSSIAGPGGPWTNEATEANAAVSGYEVAAATGTATYSGTFGSASTYEAIVCTFAFGSGTPANVTGLAAPAAAAGGAGTPAGGASVTGLAAAVAVHGGTGHSRAGRTSPA